MGPDGPSRWLPLAIVVLVPALFWSSLGGEFLHWDDDVNFIDNPSFRGLSWTHLRWTFTTTLAGHYHPLTWISLGLDYTLWGIDPRGYHLTNVALHTANAALVYFLFAVLLRRALGDGWRRADLRLAAFVGALGFAVHPLRVESVAWLSERRDLLAAAFYLLALLAYVRAHPGSGRARPGWRCAALGCVALSLLAKAWAITFPAVLLALDAYPLRRFAAGRTAVPGVLIEKLPYAVLGAAAAVVAALAQTGMPGSLSLAEHGVLARLAQAAYGLWFYLAKTVAPVGLSPAYLLEPRLDPISLRYLGPAAAVAALSAIAWRLRRRWPAVPIAGATYAIIVSPVLGVLQTGPQIAADRYTYLATLPIALLAGAGVARWHRAGRTWALPAAAAALALLGVLTVRQIGVWRDTPTLWEHALRLDPSNWLAHANRGAYHERQDLPALALADYSAAIAANPWFADMYFRRANLRQAAHDIDGALDDYSTALRLDPADAEAYATRGSLRAANGDRAGAVADYRAALRAAPAGWVHRRAVEQELAAAQTARPRRRASQPGR